MLTLPAGPPGNGVRARAGTIQRGGVSGRGRYDVGRRRVHWQELPGVDSLICLQSRNHAAILESHESSRGALASHDHHPTPDHRGRSRRHAAIVHERGDTRSSSPDRRRRPRSEAATADRSLSDLRRRHSHRSTHAGRPDPRLVSICRRFDRDPERDLCRTCGRAVIFTPSRRRDAAPGDGSWAHAGPTIASELAELERRRRAERAS